MCFEMASPSVRRGWCKQAPHLLLCYVALAVGQWMRDDAEKFVFSNRDRPYGCEKEIMKNVFHFIFC
jgi:hypothetical protein